jgi:hypothetical protein
MVGMMLRQFLQVHQAINHEHRTMSIEPQARTTHLSRLAAA